MPSPQASAYLKQNKYQQAEELYKEILHREALPAPLGEPPAPPLPQGLLSIPPPTMSHLSPGAPNTGTAGDAQQQVRRALCGLPGEGGPGWQRRLTGVPGVLPRPFVGAAPSLSSGSPSGAEARSWSPDSEARGRREQPGESAPSPCPA